MPVRRVDTGAPTEFKMAEHDSTIEQLLVHLEQNSSGIVIRVSGLTGDEDFDPGSNCYFRTSGSLRWEVNRVLKEEAQKQGLGHHFFNHEKWPGTTSWISYSKENVSSARVVAAKVAETFGARLIVHPHFHTN